MSHDSLAIYENQSQTHLVCDSVEDIRHVAQVGGGENRIEQLSLPFVLGADGGEQAGPKESVHGAVAHWRKRKFKVP